MRTGNGEWPVSIVISNKLPRFSGGWNQFARDNELIVDERVVFTLVEEVEATVFLVTFPERN